MRYLGEPDYRHGEKECLGVLLVNLGSPEAPTPNALRQYLAQFLNDPRIVEAPRWLWWLVLHGIILRVRPRRSAAAYKRIWRKDGSPLIVYSRRQANALQSALEAEFQGCVAVQVAMRYGNPSIPAGLRTLQGKGARRMLVLPLFPQYSAATTASVFDAVSDVLQHTRWVPELRFVNQYLDEPRYIEAVADSIRETWRAHRKGDLLLFSFHGIPKRYMLAGDPYHCQCQKTARQIADNLRLKENEWTVTFQSRFGPAEWLKPYTDKILVDVAKRGVKRVDIVCPGFAADCLETLEEVQEQYHKLFLKAGGSELIYVPALNDRPDHIKLLTHLVERHTQGWPETSTYWSEHEAAKRWAESRDRALAKGAKR